MKRKNKIKIPRYVDGGLLSNVDLNKLTVGAQLAGTGMQAAGGTVGDVGSVLGDTASLAGTGMAVGGPIGAAVGGGLGLVKGIAGLISGNSAKKKAEARARNKQTQAFAAATTQSMVEDYYGENQLANTFAMGGIMPTSPAYLDNGELVKTPDGRINEVTGGPNVQDGVLANLPGGTKILSDKLKVPGTNKTFAQMGRGLQKKSKNKDAFATTAAELNARNFDKLLAYQEQIKAEKGIRPKAKSINAYANGGRVTLADMKDVTPEVLPLDYMPVALTGTTILSAPSLAQKTKSATSDLPTLAKDLNTKSSNIKSAATNTTTNKSPYGVLGGISSLAPTLYNMAESFKSPEVEQVTLNPYLGNINKLLANRRMNIQPMINANRRSRAIGNYNLSQLNTNTGAGLAARIQNTVNDYTTTADIYANAQNANNAYMGEQAQMLGNLGNQYVSNRMAIDDINARNRAARRAYGSAAVSQLGKWGQTQQLMKNTANRDAMIMPFLMENMGQGYTSDLITNMRKQFYGY